MEELKNKDFEKNPNLEFKEIIKEMDFCFGINDIFDIYYDKKQNNELFLISADKNDSISITRIKDKKLIKSIPRGFKKSIKMLRHFYSPIKTTDYLISSFSNSILKIYDLSNNYNLIHTIDVDYSSNSIIYSSLLYFSEKGDFLITSSNSNENNDYTKIYDFSNGALVENINFTNRVDIYYLLLWNKENNDYLIQCSIRDIYLYNFENKDITVLHKNENSTIHNSACLVKKNDGIDYLYVGNVNGLIDVWNLQNYNLEQSIKYSKSYFYHLISWNNRYILVAEKMNCSIIVIDTEVNKVVSVYKDIHQSFVVSLKKIMHPIYGECLLSSDLNNEIYLWTHR